MATKADFTAEEWGKLLGSPMVAGMAITAADPSGVWGLIKEGMAESGALFAGFHRRSDHRKSATRTAGRS